MTELRDGVGNGRVVNEAMIARCRLEIESPAKRVLRGLLLPIIRRYIGLRTVGEGFQWGLPLNVPRGALDIGRYVYVGAHCSASGPIVIGDLCMISTHVRFVGNDHRTDIVGGPTRLEFTSDERPTTVLEADCWIGQGAIIREGVKIGRGAVVAAGAIVTRSVEPYAVVAGAPARPLRFRFSPEDIEAHDRVLFE